MTDKSWSDLADGWLKADGPAALVCRQWLVPAEGRDAVVFPPTFANEEGEQKGSRYNIDSLSGGTRVALIDTVGAQANRMEPMFKHEPYRTLVPQIEIKAGAKTVHLLDAGHRAADAIVRYSSLASELVTAFRQAQEHGDIRPLAKLAPTSLVFGAWDSRDTQAKLPRLVRAEIRAYGVEPLKRSAVYNPPLDYVKAGFIDDADDRKKVLSELGFLHAPATGTLGGVIARGEIRREVLLSLVGVRALGPSGEAGDAVRRYMLGLAVVAMTYDQSHDLRQGCLLVGDPDRKPVWETVGHDGTRTPIQPDHVAALAFAKEAARRFGVGPDREVTFDKDAANKAIAERSGAGKKTKAKAGG